MEAGGCGHGSEHLCLVVHPGFVHLLVGWEVAEDDSRAALSCSTLLLRTHSQETDGSKVPPHTLVFVPLRWSLLSRRWNKVGLILTVHRSE